MNYFLQLDINLFYFFNNLSNKNNFFNIIIRFFSVYLIYLVPICLIVSWFIYKKETQRIDMLKVTLTSVFLWQIPTRIISLIWYRPRPIIDLAGTKEIFFHVPSYSFPSDHSTFLAAFATYFYLLGYKKISYICFGGAFLVGLFRIIGGFHYPLDVLAGWLLGILGAMLLHKLDKYIEKYLAKPLFKFAKFIKLA